MTTDDEQYQETLITAALSVTAGHDSWVIDSGATSHMCNNKNLFVELNPIPNAQEVTLGDGHKVEATAVGTVQLETLLPDGQMENCQVIHVLYVPQLSCNLLSVSKAIQTNNEVAFTKHGCEIRNNKNKIIAMGTKVGGLYQLEFCRKQKAHVAEKGSKERLWHRWYGHLGEQNLKTLAACKMVDKFDFDTRHSISFCEPCVGGKHHKSKTC